MKSLSSSGLDLGSGCFSRYLLVWTGKLLSSVKTVTFFLFKVGGFLNLFKDKV